MQGGGDVGSGTTGFEIPIRATGLFLRRPRFAVSHACVQSNGDAQRHLGKDQWEDCEIAEFTVRKRPTTFSVAVRLQSLRLQLTTDQSATANAMSSSGHQSSPVD